MTTQQPTYSWLRGGGSHPKQTLILVIICVGVLVGALLSSLLISGWYIRQTAEAVRQQNFNLASQTATKAHRWLRPVRFVTAQTIPDLEIANAGLLVLTELSDVDILLTNLKQLNDTELPSPHFDTTAISIQLNTLHQLVPHSWLLDSHQQQLATQLLSVSQDTLSFYNQLRSGPQTLLLVFQNSDELRATGGFMGSFAKVEFKDGLIHALTIEDIYQPDGQFTGYVAAPPGVAEYLSSGNGLRLPDSNWFPDFPTSAQTILSYFALGTESNITGVVALNSNLVTALLQLTGPLELLDFQTTVTAANFTQVARSDRANFFPGSRQKSMFLKSFFTQFKLALAKLVPDRNQDLWAILTTAGSSKNLQVFMLDDTLQKIVQKYQFDGAVTVPPTTDEYLFLVESNVGINKVNPAITRSVTIDISDYQLTVKISFTNQSTQDQYINYQRFIVPTTVKLHQATYNNQELPLSAVHSHLLTTASQLELQQYGLLVELPANTQRTLELSFTTNHYYQNSTPSIFIQKQAGLSPTPYTINFQTISQQLLLEKDTLVKMIQ